MPLLASDGRPIHRNAALVGSDQHPVEAAKAQPGMHSTGLAADIGISGSEAVTLLRLALDAGFRGVGVQQKGSGRFLHVDLRETPTIWSY